MKNIVNTVIKVLIILILVVWVFFVFTDYMRAKDGKKPKICLKETSEKWNDGDYYECTSFGYRYYELKKKDNTKDYGFITIFSKNPIKEKYGE